MDQKIESQKNGQMSRMHAFETNMSLTGSNADYRSMVKPSEFGKVATALLNAVSGRGAAGALSEGVQQSGQRRKILRRRGRTLSYCPAPTTSTYNAW